MDPHEMKSMIVCHTDKQDIKIH